MKIKKESNNSYSSKEIAGFLNNAVQACIGTYYKPLPQLRRQKLREYALAFLEPALEHLQEFTEDGVTYPAPLTSKELTYILICSALFIHLQETLGTDKFPMAGEVNKIFGESD